MPKVASFIVQVRHDSQGFTVRAIDPHGRVHGESGGHISLMEAWHSFVAAIEPTVARQAEKLAASTGS
jgi:hypothetical protein